MGVNVPFDESVCRMGGVDEIVPRTVSTETEPIASGRNREGAVLVRGFCSL